MAPDVETAQTLQDFKGNLNDVERQRRLRSVSPSLLLGKEKMVLRELYRHFCALGDKKRQRGGRSREEQESGENTDQETDALEPKWKRMKVDRKHPWKTFVDLRSLRLPPDVEQQIEKHGTDPLPFLDDPIKLQHGIRSSNSTGDAVLASYDFMMRLRSRAAMDMTRRCFQLLAFYDMVKEIHPGSTGARIGNRMQREIVPIFEKVFGRDQAKINEAMENLQEWSNWGHRVNHICEAFGTGCVFFLANYLTEHFLKNRFTAKNDYHDEAFEHLTWLGLKDLASEPPLDQLALNIRQRLLRPFRVAKQDEPKGAGRSS